MSVVLLTSECFVGGGAVMIVIVWLLN